MLGGIGSNSLWWLISAVINPIVVIINWPCRSVGRATMIVACEAGALKI